MAWFEIRQLPVHSFDVRSDNFLRLSWPEATDNNYEELGGAAYRMENVKKRSRASVSRAKTGCMTCKIRKVKCDEAKPSCRRCISTGRKCDGYNHVAKQPSAPGGAGLTLNTMVVYRAPWSLSIREQQSLDFFLAESKTRFPAEFCRPILKAANTEAVLAHAVISFGAIHQAYEYGLVERRRVDYTPLGQFAMYQYGKSLRLLRTQTQQSQFSESLMSREDIALACCVLFACFESIRGCRRSTIIHITKGLNLLRQYRAKPQTTQRALVPKQVLTSLLTRLDNQLVELLGTAISQTLSDQEYNIQASSALETIEEVRAADDAYHSLDGLLNNIFHDRLNVALAFEEHKFPNMSSDQGQISRCLEDLRRNFASASIPEHSTPGERDLYGPDPDILQIWYILGSIYISIPPGEGHENAWDKFVIDFDSIVSLAENYNNRSRSSKGSSRKRTFSFSLGIIPPLFVAASRCRDRNVRRRAINLLGSCSRQEILWDSNLATKAARHVIQIEEGSASTEEGSARIYNVSVVLDDEDGAFFEFQKST